ncbi:RNA polymerase sigma-70 factor (sigma-E family) [Micromonospora sp. Llam0]|uniref:SigE family RNA polymerase sigma factor n=1 Tax=Micromonospora sp. Llam0 TaxID=2485143 RepID=UPI000F96B3FD|nr:SigE family RNA polymerase sigma factor [Micromonospora sp. Llam0]ROO62150.1 RNA polymerase sigma-70 factor (sigma-E family) [Micromonospora sp. Llam0]
MSGVRVAAPVAADLPAEPAPTRSERVGGPLARWSAARRQQRVAGDEAFTAFVVDAAPRLRRVAYLMCRDWHLAQDLTQITFTRMYASWNRIWPTANLDAYSRRVLINAVSDAMTRRSRTEVVLAEPPEPAARPAAGGSTELQVALLQALAEFPVRDRAVLVLRYWEDQSVQTVAEILGITTSAVKMCSMRALQRLRTVLGEDFPIS